MKYLNNDEVLALCTELSLEDKKIKIWFQNRRAREKRKVTQEEEIDVTTVEDIDMANALQNMTVADECIYENKE